MRSGAARGVSVDWAFDGSDIRVVAHQAGELEPDLNLAVDAHVREWAGE